MLPGFLIILLIVSMYSWFNEYRRIKFLIKGSLNNFDAQEIKKDNTKIEENDEEDEKEKKVTKRVHKLGNEKNLYKLYQLQDGIRYDIFGRPIFKTKKVSNENLRTSNALKHSRRKSILNNRVSVYKSKNSIKIGPNACLDFKSSNSSDRNSSNKFRVPPQNNNNV